MKKSNKKLEPASFRDPSGFVFLENGKIFRQINLLYKNDYDALISSGLYSKLSKRKLLVSHKEIKPNQSYSKNLYKVIEPDVIPFVSYPYEWCFGQLKAAALLTLKIQRVSLKHNMILKDASAYNIQFIGAKPIFIDTLSFEKYAEGEPWIAYRQFCQHFLAPLFLMATVDLRLNALLESYLDGIPLDLTSKLLPKKSWFKFGTLTHLHLHAKSQKVFASKTQKPKKHGLSKKALQNLINNLQSTIERLKFKRTKTTWSDYYNDTNYTKSAFLHKKELVKKYLKKSRPKTVLDLGANTGVFSLLAADQKAYTLSVDNDPLAVSNNFEALNKSNDHILPLVIDLTNPSPSVGWGNSERPSFLKRINKIKNLTMSLALIHHLAISNNLPLDRIASVFKNFGQYLIIEFIPKSDSQVTRLLSQRKDIFPEYNEKQFEQVFARHYSIRDSSLIMESSRKVYLMERND